MNIAVSLSAPTLEDRITRAARAYYNDEPIMSDDEFDTLVDRLRAKNPKSPVLKQIGAPVVGRKVKLPHPMFSLHKIKPETAVRWLMNIGPVDISDKLDGFSLQLVYNDKGVLKIYTRGNGRLAKDVSYLVPHLDLPKAKNFVVRCEGILPAGSFDAFAKEFVNARSLMSTVFNRLSGSVNVRATRAVKIVALEIIGSPLKPSAQRLKLKAMGFDVPWSKQLTNPTPAQLSKILTERKSRSKFKIDGLVVIKDEPYTRETNGNPEYARAFKETQSDEYALAEVVRVEWNVSRTGALKPVVIVKEVSDATRRKYKSQGF